MDVLPLNNLRRITPARVWREVGTQSARARRWLDQRQRFGREAETRPLFVVGCHRSGTNMVMWTVERSPDIWVYHEHSWSPAFVDYRLRETRVIERLIERCPAPVVGFKPVCDSHLADRYLERHAGARVVWIYRRYPDVANSMVRSHRHAQKNVLRWILRGDTDWLGWRGERLAPEVMDLLRRCYRDDMSPTEIAAIRWWMRTRLFFDLELEEDERALLVRYEDLVAENDAGFRRLFTFSGLPWDPACRGHVFSSSIGKDRFPTVDPRIRDACEELQEQMDGAYARALARERDSAAKGESAHHTVGASLSR